MDVTLNESVVFGSKLAKVVRRELGRDVLFRGIQRAGFAVLKTPGIPSVLVEVGFMTNPEEALMKSSEEFQENYARALYLTIGDYFFPSSQKISSAQEAYAPGAKPCPDSQGSKAYFLHHFLLQVHQQPLEGKYQALS